jgi:diadenosine tetraphosphate (Ap4A) HIT family hydrolase
LPPFILDSRLHRDTFPIGDLPLSLLLLMNDRTYPWLILVPRRSDVREIFQLSDADREQLLRESTLVSRVLYAFCHPDKLNIAALGNVVPQLHLHHVVRYRTDPAWPAPVWGKAPATPYPLPEARAFIRQVASRLPELSPLPSP